MTPTASCPRIVPDFMPRQGSADHLQVGAADRGRRDPQDRILVMFDLGFLDVLQADSAGAAKDDCFHGVLPRPLEGVARSFVSAMNVSVFWLFSHSLVNKVFPDMRCVQHTGRVRLGRPSPPPPFCR